MTLKKLLNQVLVKRIIGPKNKTIAGINHDSRLVKPGEVFIAYKGVDIDSHQFIDQAVEKGASAVIGEKIPTKLKKGISFVQVKNSRSALAKIASNWYNCPEKNLIVIGITGTNGKTSTTYMLEAIFKKAGLQPGVIGTINYRYKNIIQPARETTPDAITLHKLLNKFVQAGCKCLIIEATSQGLKQKRLASLKFDRAIFTNLTQDHLDYHKTMADYFQAKLQLFKQLKTNGQAILNADDKASYKIAKNINQKIVFYGLKNKADFNKKHLKVKLKMLGNYNLYNALCASACARSLNIKQCIINQALANVQVPGRFESVDCGQKFKVIIDYAHTPDALERLLENARKITANKLICVFGCGGDRDKTKRPKMGEIAQKKADKIIITNDNPRTENPKKIIQHIKTGFKKKKNYIIIANRKKAINQAISQAKKGDCVVIAGKGHENYQIIGTKKTPFDDKKIAQQALKKQLC